MSQPTEPNRLVSVETRLAQLEDIVSQLNLVWNRFADSWRDGVGKLEAIEKELCNE
jgi:hypothetical protein